MPVLEDFRMIHPSLDVSEKETDEILMNPMILEISEKMEISSLFLRRGIFFMIYFNFNDAILNHFRGMINCYQKNIFIACSLNVDSAL